jgi:hypothetical protein
MIAQTDVGDPARPHGRDVAPTTVDGTQGRRRDEVPVEGYGRRSYRWVEAMFAVCIAVVIAFVGGRADVAKTTIAVFVDAVRFVGLVVDLRSKCSKKRGQSRQIDVLSHAR